MRIDDFNRALKSRAERDCKWQRLVEICTELHDNWSWDDLRSAIYEAQDRVQAERDDTSAEDERLADARHGQAEEINRERG